MTLKLQILQSLRRLLLILISLMMTLFSEKMFISNLCISGLMPNLIKKSWTLKNVLKKYDGLLCGLLPLLAPLLRDIDKKLPHNHEMIDEFSSQNKKGP